MITNVADQSADKYGYLIILTIFDHILDVCLKSFTRTMVKAISVRDVSLTRHMFHQAAGITEVAWIVS